MSVMRITDFYHIFEDRKKNVIFTHNNFKCDSGIQWNIRSYF